MKTPVRIAVTGAAGQIGYALLFRIASGELLGKDQPVILQLLELPIDKAQAALKGVILELEDCAFPLLAGISGTDNAEVAFKDADIAFLVGAKPRGPGMERKDLLQENAKIFTAQGAALNKVASRNVKVLVVGNPANTNAWIAARSAPDLPAKNFIAKTARWQLRQLQARNIERGHVRRGRRGNIAQLQPGGGLSHVFYHILGLGDGLFGVIDGLGLFGCDVVLQLIDDLRRGLERVQAGCHNQILLLPGAISAAMECTAKSQPAVFSMPMRQ